MYSDSGYTAPSVKPGDFNTIMPWFAWAHLCDDQVPDLGAIYTYIHSLPPKQNRSGWRRIYTWFGHGEEIKMFRLAQIIKR